MLHLDFFSFAFCLLLSFCVAEEQPYLKLNNCKPKADPGTKGKICDAEHGPFDLSAQTAVEVELEDGHVAVFYKKATRGKGWHGETETGQSFTLVNVHSQNFAVFDYGGIVYEVYQETNGHYQVLTIPQSEFPPEDNSPPMMAEVVITPEVDNIFIRNLTPRDKIGNLNSHDDSEEVDQQLRGLRGGNPRYLQSGPTIVDVLIVWTRKAECKESGLTFPCALSAATEDKMRMLLDVAIANANAAYANSNVDIELRLVHAYRDEDYEENLADPHGVAIGHLSFNGDGYLDGVHNKRDSFGADIVSLIYDRAGANVCGRASLTDPPNADSMFSVTSYDCIERHTFVHEIGHNFGCFHNRESTTDDDPYAHGYQNAVDGYRSIMAVNCIPPVVCERQLFLSNPDMLFQNKVNGAADADCARQHNEQKDLVEGFRATKPNCTVDAECDDGDGNTFNICDGGSCSNPLCLTDADCDDSNPFTQRDFCDCGACRNYQCIDDSSCVDAYDCTTSVCLLPGYCQHSWVGNDPLIIPQTFQPAFSEPSPRSVLGGSLAIEPTADILISQFDVHTSSTSSITVRVSYQFGDRFDLSPNSDEWILIEEVSVIGQGRGNLTPVSLSTPVFLAATQYHTFQIISFDSEDMEWTFRSSTIQSSVSDAGMTVYDGLVVVDVDGSFGIGRYWRWEGTIHYHFAADQPDCEPSGMPSSMPSADPSGAPSVSPSVTPSSQPSRGPSISIEPSEVPTKSPSVSQQPSTSPSQKPTIDGTAAPSISSAPSGTPSLSMLPSLTPSSNPSSTPSKSPTDVPSESPSGRPSNLPSHIPSFSPSQVPSRQPSNLPSSLPSIQPSSQPSQAPSNEPSNQPSASPSRTPSKSPSQLPSMPPTTSSVPSMMPSASPSTEPSVVPSQRPSGSASDSPSHGPSMEMSCTNDPDWIYTPRRGRSRTCDWVGARHGRARAWRCLREGTNGNGEIVTAVEACPEFCSEACQPTASPTLSPSAMPSPTPSESTVPSTSVSPTTGCTNNPDWYFVNKWGYESTCDYVRQDPEQRCNILSEQLVSALVGCAEFCDVSCFEEEEDDECVDDESWYTWHRGRWKTCEWVGRKNTWSRCQTCDSYGVHAYEACCVCQEDDDEDHDDEDHDHYW
mmetsp:Transcript_13716/g.21621  ORF Transcript_13716/g.21621 Transcript_13716/m.21621 type:complete len:1135 (+) Transcript_13716:83-3487(+)|eukprot:CAMPEP_0117073488 /NCGR_PEP_ID=MMETSP0472-20121206/51756_1 /TAXON_ID=693140 ORGANISM="Tiarina fusus, Strain LIS" /NCGR_SAMPLE_ID=MMETSP0472 /ASSEMBLY_ACC=CAM_ASM_000603 /LENGTH=1134 /DNA_ID=CAMNT_0004798083 /DNA_START=73 /DNA_END=3477 /DNA_ORIENTATION=-